MSGKMNTMDRSKMANETKREYIKASKAKNVVRKLNEKAKNSNLNKIKKTNKKKDSNEEIKNRAEHRDSLDNASEINTSDISTDTSDEEQYILHFSSDSEIESNKKRYARKKDKKNNKVLELQKEIELLKLQQLKQNKKVERAKRDNHISRNVPIREKQPNTKADAIKNKLLIEF